MTSALGGVGVRVEFRKKIRTLTGSFRDCMKEPFLPQAGFVCSDFQGLGKNNTIWKHGIIIMGLNHSLVGVGGCTSRSHLGARQDELVFPDRAGRLVFQLHFPPFFPHLWGLAASIRATKTGAGLLHAGC